MAVAMKTKAGSVKVIDLSVRDQLRRAAARNHQDQRGYDRLHPESSHQETFQQPAATATGECSGDTAGRGGERY